MHEFRSSWRKSMRSKCMRIGMSEYLFFNMFRNIKRYSELIKTDKESRNYIHNYSNSVNNGKERPLK